MNPFKPSFLLIALILSLALLIGCGGGGGGSATLPNPVAPPAAPLPPAEDPAVVPDPVGNSTISTTITLPGVDTSLRAVSTSKYATGKLYVDGVLFQTVAVDFVGSSATLTFTGVKDSGVAKLDVELTGCSIYGVTSFTKTGNISSNLTLTVEPIYPTGSIVTSDNRMLTEVGTPTGEGAYLSLGWVIGNTKVSFNDLGQPIGMGNDGYVTNFITNQKYVNLSGLKVNGNDVIPQSIVWYDGKIIIAGQNMVYQVNPGTGAASEFSGDFDSNVPTISGSTLADATFTTLRDAEVIGGKLYLTGNYNQIIRLDGDTFNVVTTVNNFDEFSITEDGEIFLLNFSDGIKYHIAKLIGSDPVIQPDLDLPAPGGLATRNIVKYKDGYLRGIHGKILYIKNGAATTWLDTAAIKGSSDGDFSIYKNHLGEIYVISDEKNKIWKLN